MKQIIIRRGSVCVDDIPAPLIEDGHVLVEVAYSLVSTGTELNQIRNSGKSLVGRALEQPKRTKKLIQHLLNHGIGKTFSRIMAQVDDAAATGYSCAGTVVQVGQGVGDLQSGDRVACTGAGIANHAEIVVVPRNLLVRLPDNCSLKDAASVALGSIAMQGVRRANPALGEVVAVLGLGLLGQLTVQLLNVAGSRIIGLDPDKRRRAMAQRFGASHLLDPLAAEVKNEIRHLTENQGVDITIITAAAPGNEILQQAMEITRKKGRVVIVGDVGLGLQRAPFYEKEIDLLISCSYGPGRYDAQYEKMGLDYPYAYVRWTENRNQMEYLRLIADKKLDLSPIFEREFDLENAPEAYASLEAGEERPLAAILRYPVAVGAAPRKKLVTKVTLCRGLVTGKIRVALIGAGSFAKEVHLPNLKELTDLYELRAIVSRNGAEAKAVARRFGAEYASTSYQEVLSDADVDAVMICTRHHLHAQMAIEAARAGKAVFLEKPMATTQLGLGQLISVLQETEVPFMVGFNRRFSPAAKLAHAAVQGRTNPLVIHYRVNAGFLPAEHWTQTSEGGGRIIGEGCHMLDLMHYLVGAREGTKTAGMYLSPATGHVLAEDNLAAVMRFVDGSVGSFVYTSLGNEGLGKEYIEIFWDGKIIIIDDFCHVRNYGCPAATWHSKSPDKGHLEELRAFAAYVSGKCSSPIPLADMIAVTQQTLALACTRPA